MQMSESHRASGLRAMTDFGLPFLFLSVPLCEEIEGFPSTLCAPAATILHLSVWGQRTLD